MNQPPNLVDFIENTPYNADFFTNMKYFLKHAMHSDMKNIDKLMFQNDPIVFKETIFGMNRTFQVHHDRSSSQNICWICSKRIEKGTEIWKKLDPVILAIIYMSYFLTVPSLPKPSWKKNQHQFKTYSEIEDICCHPCCDLGMKEFNWIKFNGTHFSAEDLKIKKALRIIAGRKNCDTITISNLSIRSKYVYYTPTNLHLKLWTLYVFYILCVLQLKNSSNRVDESTQQESNSKNKSIFGMIKLLQKMNSIKKRIISLKHDLKTSRIYGKALILQFCNYHFKEYCRDNIIKLSDTDIKNTSKFFEV